MQILLLPAFQLVKPYNIFLYPYFENRAFRTFMST